MEYSLKQEDFVLVYLKAIRIYCTLLKSNNYIMKKEAIFYIFTQLLPLEVAMAIVCHHLTLSPASSPVTQSFYKSVVLLFSFSLAVPYLSSTVQYVLCSSSALI
ncbi:hypothetical protein ATANTOWER_031163 [Ataeniobius toweri]|uniref:Uncharacterized protein n=1 Tax=Ataeniobius toweri TaxID=208326 RepID=A0ABU7CM95_9TELE|nr:hypothetical protein [Ataeniobius toweri]